MLLVNVDSIVESNYEHLAERTIVLSTFFLRIWFFRFGSIIGSKFIKDIFYII